MPANDKQVDGSHYKGEYQHWDWVFDTSQNYHEARATAYFARWRKKNGLVDIEKGVHFLEKCLELYGRSRAQKRNERADLREFTERFCEEGGLDQLERLIMISVVFGHYEQALALVRRLRRAAEHPV